MTSVTGETAAPTLRLGSFCSGYGGLDMAVAAVLPVRTAWVADPDPGAAAVLAHRWPDVPNLGDITAPDFHQVPPVDVLCAGFPCQDISNAGHRAGIKEGTRSGLWHTIAHAIGVLRPGLVVLENVRAIVARRPGLDVVLADLARLGFDADWTCVRASDVGAPHRRERWFLAAQDTNRAARGERWITAPGQTPGRWSWADARRRGGAPVPDSGRHPRPQDDPYGSAAARRGGAAADAEGHRWDEGRPEPTRQQGGTLAAVRSGSDWGPYAPAITRWEHATGRSAPDPTVPGRDGRPRLNPVFVEWLMGLPSGWVTAVPGLTRNQQLRLLGNGVVPHQGAAALTALLTHTAPARRSAA